jgi:hypothetical protein
LPKRGRITLSVVGVLLALTLPAHAQEKIWLNGVDPVWRAVHGWPANDYIALFGDAPFWSKVRGRLEAFEISKRFAESGNERDLRLIITTLQHYGIALAVQTTPLVPTVSCGRGVEGYGGPSEMRNVMMRLRNLGAMVKYADFDEPLYYGAVFSGNRNVVTCQSPIGELARSAAAQVRQIKSIFPNILVGDTEPIGLIRPKGMSWADLVSNWLSAYKEASGESLAFVHVDVVWWAPDWQQQLRGVSSSVHKSGIEFGTIINGLPDAHSDQEWVAQAVSHLQTIRTFGVGAGDTYSFATWEFRPTTMKPSQHGGSLTDLLVAFIDGKI